jgi:hypothetical protein
MQCLNCGGGFEYAQNGAYCRCVRCLSLFKNEMGRLTPIVVEAPGGGNNPEFNAIFARNLGFGPPPQQQQQHDYGRGQFELGGGHQLQVKINGQTPESYAKGMVWGWIIGAAILGIVLLSVVGVGIYIYVVAKDESSPVTKAATAKAASWDGKSTLDCKGNDVMAIEGVTATVSDTAIRAAGNCQLTLTNVKITAPVGIEASANAKVTMTGGSINASSNSVVASAGANVVISGAQVTGKSKKSGGAKIVGAP